MSAKPTAEQAAVIVPVADRSSVFRQSLIATIGLAVWPILQFGGDGQLGSAGLSAALATIGFIVAIVTFRAALTVGYNGQGRLLIGGMIAGLVAGALIVPKAAWWPMCLLTLALGFTPLVASTNLRRFAGHKRSYALGALCLLVFGTAAFLPVWPGMMEFASGYSAQVVEQVKSSLMMGGYSPDLIDTYSDAVRESFKIVVRLIPAFMLLSLLVEFTSGYLWFSARESKTALALAGPEPFVRWKMPYGVILVAVPALLGRLLGSEGIQLWSDNLLVILAVLYVVAGMAVIEHYQRWFGFPPVLRFLFYALIAVSQLIGFGFAVLLGFMDSFFDWRKIESSQPTVKKNVSNNRINEVEDESHSS